MQATQPTAVRPPKNIYLQKAEYLFATGGAAAAAGFAVDIAGIAGVDATMAMVKFLDAKGRATESLAVLKEVCRNFEDRLDVHETLGKRLKGKVTKIAAPVAGETKRIPVEECEFITVVGNSFVRSFASGTRILPLMVGPANWLSFLTPESADITKRVAWNTIKRVDPKSLVLMVFSNADPACHAIGLHGTRKAVEEGALPSHEAAVRAGAARYFEMVDEVLAKTPLNLVLFSATPMLTPETRTLVKVFNEELAEYGRRSGLPILDLTEELTDPATGYLKPHLRSAPDDPHMTHEIMPMVERGLKNLNMLPGEGHSFDWEYMFRFSLDPQVEMRIWNEPHLGGKNIVHSHKVKFAQILERAANILIGHLALEPDSDILVLNGREGFLALEVPPNVAGHITSVDKQVGKALMGQRVSRVIGRTDIQFKTVNRLREAANEAYDYVVLVIHENDELDECMEALTAVMENVRRRVLVLTVLDLAGQLNQVPHVESVSEINLSNRLITGYWSGVRLFALSRAALSYAG